MRTTRSYALPRTSQALYALGPTLGEVVSADTQYIGQLIVDLVIVHISHESKV